MNLHAPRSVIGSTDRRRFRFNTRAQELGFALDEIDGLLDLRVDDPVVCGKVASKMRDLERHLRQLQRGRSHRALVEIRRVAEAERRVLALNLCALWKKHTTFPSFA